MKRTLIHAACSPLVVLVMALCLIAWKGAFRTQDLSVFKLWLPVPPAQSPEVRPSRMVSLGVTKGAQPRFALSVGFSSGGGGVPESVSSYEIIAQSSSSYAVELRAKEGDPALGSENRRDVRFSQGPEGTVTLSLDEKTFSVALARRADGALAEPGLETWTSPVVIAERELLAVVSVQREGAAAPDIRQQIVLLRLPPEEVQPRHIEALPLVDLAGLGLTEPVRALALLGDSKTIALLPASLPSSLGYPMWLVRLPGSLSVSTVPIYIAAGVAILVSVLLLLLGFKGARSGGVPVPQS